MPGELRIQSAVGSITFDDGLAPLVVVTFVGQVTAGQYEQFLATHLAYLRRGRCLFVFDTSRAGTSLVEHRQRQVKWTEAHERLLKESLIGTASVITSPAIRLLANFLHHLKPLPHPQFFARALPEAMDWARALLGETGHAPAWSLGAGNVPGASARGRQQL